MPFWNRKKESGQIIDNPVVFGVLPLEEALKRTTEAVNRNTEQTVRALNEMTKALNKMSVEISRRR